MTYLPSYAKDSSWSCPHLVEKCLFLKLFLQPAGHSKVFGLLIFANNFQPILRLAQLLTAWAWMNAKTQVMKLHMVIHLQGWGVNFQLRTATFWIDLLHSIWRKSGAFQKFHMFSPSHVSPCYQLEDFRNIKTTHPTSRVRCEHWLATPWDLLPATSSNKKPCCFMEVSSVQYDS